MAALKAATVVMDVYQEKNRPLPSERRKRKTVGESGGLRDKDRKVMGQLGSDKRQHRAQPMRSFPKTVTL